MKVLSSSQFQTSLPIPALSARRARPTNAKIPCRTSAGRPPAPSFQITAAKRAIYATRSKTARSAGSTSSSATLAATCKLSAPADHPVSRSRSRPKAAKSSNRLLVLHARGCSRENITEHFQRALRDENVKNGVFRNRIITTKRRKNFPTKIWATIITVEIQTMILMEPGVLQKTRICAGNTAITPILLVTSVFSTMADATKYTNVLIQIG